MAQSKTDIFNLALSFLGAQRVASPLENSKNARALSDVYDIVRRSEIRKAPAWNFAIKNVKLPQDVVAPLFDMAYAYTLPNDFISIQAPFDKSNYNTRDWIIQGNKLYTDWSPPLDFRYNADISDEGLMDPLFATAFAAKLAETIADTITQSNSKIQIANERYKQAIEEARKANSFDIVSNTMPQDDWWTVRL